MAENTHKEMIEKIYKAMRRIGLEDRLTESSQRFAEIKHVDYGPMRNKWKSYKSDLALIEAHENQLSLLQDALGAGLTDQEKVLFSFQMKHINAKIRLCKSSISYPPKKVLYTIRNSCKIPTVNNTCKIISEDDIFLDSLHIYAERDSHYKALSDTLCSYFNLQQDRITEVSKADLRAFSLEDIPDKTNAVYLLDTSSLDEFLEKNQTADTKVCRQANTYRVLQSEKDITILDLDYE